MAFVTCGVVLGCILHDCSPQNLKMRKWCIKPSASLKFKGSYAICRSPVVTPFVDLVTGFDLNFNPGYLTTDS
jgi:hypothetical protein